jgi:RHS repeat-associated protein
MIGASADSNYLLGARGVSLFGRNGLVTTSFQYDNDGNVIQKTTDGTTTTYIYDYLNHLTALGSAGATTTYAYDAFGTRILQTGTSTTTFYPFKWYSVASSTGSGAKYATTTSYVFNGDTLLATVDQQTASGVATGTPATHYIHPDHLGSTNVVTNASGNVEQTLDYYPYGATRISASAGTNEGRKYIGQFADQSNLDYLQARYYDPSRGQFLTEDPVFLGDPKEQDLANPQSLNSYSYANDNPITGKDPDGKQVAQATAVTLAAITVTLLRIAATLTALAASGAIVSSPQGQQALNNLSGSLTQLSQNITSASIGMIMSMTFVAGAAHASPQNGLIGGTAATTPYVIGSPYSIAPGVTAQSDGIPYFNLSEKGQAKGTPKPTDAPSGTVPIDQAGLPRGTADKIKKIIDAKRNDWTGIAPNGDIITGTPDGKAINHGPIVPF